MKLVSVLFQAIGRISQTNKNTLSEAWNKSEKHRIRQKAKIFGCLSYSIPISQTGISQKGNFGVSGLFQGQKVSGLFCTLRGKWVSGLFYGRISGLFCGLVWLSIVTRWNRDSVNCKKSYLGHQAFASLFLPLLQANNDDDVFKTNKQKRSAS